MRAAGPLAAGQPAEAQEALDILTGSAPQDLEDDLDPEILMAYDLIDAEQLAQRQTRRRNSPPPNAPSATGSGRSVSVIVDEAQELSAMAWRMLMRRIPNRWMTIIGDTAQTGDLAGTRIVAGRAGTVRGQAGQLRELTVNYRTPAEITRYANRVLHHINPEHFATDIVAQQRNRAVCGGSAGAAVVGALATGWVTAVIAPDDECAPSSPRADTGVAATADAGADGDGGKARVRLMVVVEPAAIPVAVPTRSQRPLRGSLRVTQRLRRCARRAAVKNCQICPETGRASTWCGRSGRPRPTYARRRREPNPADVRRSS